MIEPNFHYFGHLLIIASGDPEVARTYNIAAQEARRRLRYWSGAPSFNRWAQALRPRHAAHLFAMISAPEVPTDTSSGSGSP